MAQSLDMGSTWDVGLIQYSIAYLLHRNKDKIKAHTILLEAERAFQDGQRIRWTGGFQSKWHDILLQQMNSI